jgi:hypothetical protein
MEELAYFAGIAERIALTNGPMRKQVADDLGLGMSKLHKWISVHRVTDVVSEEDLSLVHENNASGVNFVSSNRRGTSRKATQYAEANIASMT